MLLWDLPNETAYAKTFARSAIRRASLRLKVNSGTLRALIAPSDSAVCPASTTILNFSGSHFTEVDFEAACFDASGLASWGLGKAARFDCSALLLCHGHCHAASQTSSGSSASTRIEAIKARPRGGWFAIALNVASPIPPPRSLADRRSLRHRQSVRL